MTILVASVVLLYVLVCLLAILVVVLYRQFGLVYVGSRRSYEMSGPPVGARAPIDLRVVSPNGADTDIPLDWSAAKNGGGTLLLLGGEACAICEHLLHHLDEHLPSRLDAIRVMFIDREIGGAPTTVKPSSVGRWQHWRSPDGAVHAAFDVEVSPFAILIDREGIIRAKGIVSTPRAVVDLLDNARRPNSAVAHEPSTEVDATLVSSGGSNRQAES